MSVLTAKSGWVSVSSVPLECFSGRRSATSAGISHKHPFWCSVKNPCLFCTNSFSFGSRLVAPWEDFFVSLWDSRPSCCWRSSFFYTGFSPSLHPSLPIWFLTGPSWTPLLSSSYCNFFLSPSEVEHKLAMQVVGLSVAVWFYMWAHPNGSLWAFPAGSSCPAV